MILLSLSTSVLITIFIADPNPIGPSTFGLWVLSPLGSKLIAVLSAVALVLLYNVWARRDPWLMRFERWCRRAEETPDYYS